MAFLQASLLRQQPLACSLQPGRERPDPALVSSPAHAIQDRVCRLRSPRTPRGRRARGIPLR